MFRKEATLRGKESTKPFSYLFKSYIKLPRTDGPHGVAEVKSKKGWMLTLQQLVNFFFHDDITINQSALKHLNNSTWTHHPLPKKYKRSPLWTRCWLVPAGGSRERPSLPGRGDHGTRPGRQQWGTARRGDRWRRTIGWWTAGLQRWEGKGWALASRGREKKMKWNSREAHEEDQGGSRRVENFQKVLIWKIPPINRL